MTKVNDRAKQIVEIYSSILTELKQGGVEWDLEIAALLTIASVLDQQGDIHADAIDAITGAVQALPQAT